MRNQSGKTAAGLMTSTGEAVWLPSCPWSLLSDSAGGASRLGGHSNGHPLKLSTAHWTKRLAVFL
jgi:hypothetical protein